VTGSLEGRGGMDVRERALVKRWTDPRGGGGSISGMKEGGAVPWRPAGDAG